MTTINDKELGKITLHKSIPFWKLSYSITHLVRPFVRNAKVKMLFSRLIKKICFLIFGEDFTDKLTVYNLRGSVGHADILSLIRQLNICYTTLIILIVIVLR